jgi:hypothetical protein
MPRQRLFIVSLPRSGSTVLTTMLDQYQDVLCLPESYFPALLDTLDRHELGNPERVAALFMATCLDGSPLTFAEAMDCVRNDKLATLEAIESKVAVKYGRDPGSINIVVWKYTRYVGRLPDLDRYHGHFVILRREPLNVFESQFRVDFGEKNRSTLRFALFESSYKAAFSAYPKEHSLEIDYPDLPDAIPVILRTAGSSGIKRNQGGGGLSDYSGSKPWHTEITKPFKNNDPEKLLNLTPIQKTTYRLCSGFLDLLPFIGLLARKAADQRETGAAGRRADMVLAQETGARIHS